MSGTCGKGHSFALAMAFCLILSAGSARAQLPKVCAEAVLAELDGLQQTKTRLVDEAIADFLDSYEREHAAAPPNYVIGKTVRVPLEPETRLRLLELGTIALESRPLPDWEVVRRVAEVFPYAQSDRDIVAWAEDVLKIPFCCPETPEAQFTAIRAVVQLLGSQSERKAEKILKRLAISVLVPDRKQTYLRGIETITFGLEWRTSTINAILAAVTTYFQNDDAKNFFKSLLPRASDPHHEAMLFESIQVIERMQRGEENPYNVSP